MICSGRSVVRSSRLVWDQEVAGSNPAAPTWGMSDHPPFFLTFFKLKVVSKDCLDFTVFSDGVSVFESFAFSGPVAQLDRATPF
jgi:hypothetical protein